MQLPVLLDPEFPFAFPAGGRTVVGPTFLAGTGVRLPAGLEFHFRTSRLRREKRSPVNSLVRRLAKSRQLCRTWTKFFELAQTSLKQIGRDRPRLVEIAQR